MDIAQALAHRAQRVRPPVTHLLGWVTASDVSTVTVTLESGATATVPKLRQYAAPAIDDVCLILRAGGSLFAIGALNDTPTTRPPPDDDAPPRPTVTAVTFRPVYTGTYRAGSWRGDTDNLLQGDASGGGVNYGAAFYGRGPASLAGTAVSGQVRIKRYLGGGSAPRRAVLRLLAQSQRPAGGPSWIGSPTAITSRGMNLNGYDVVGLPVSWVQALINGTAGGIGTGTNEPPPMVALYGRRGWSASMELTIRYRRS